MHFPSTPLSVFMIHFPFGVFPPAAVVVCQHLAVAAEREFPLRKKTGRSLPRGQFVVVAFSSRFFPSSLEAFLRRSYDWTLLPSTLESEGSDSIASFSVTDFSFFLLLPNGKKKKKKMHPQRAQLFDKGSTQKSSEL